MSAFAVVLAAGKGSRMKSELPKVLHPVGGVPMIEHLVDKLERMKMEAILVVVGHKGERIKEYLGARVTYVEQTEQRGTAHAVRQTGPLLHDEHGATLVLTGDTPFIGRPTLEYMLRVQRSMSCAGVVLTAMLDDPTGYGRIIRDRETGEVVDIIEEKDATPEQKKIQEVNTGIFCFDNQSLFHALPSIKNQNAQQEYYLTDMVKVMKGTDLPHGSKRFEAVTLRDPVEVMGINTPDQLAEANRAFRERIQAII